MPNVGATTLAAITLQAQQRADMVNSTFISASEWTGMVNSSCQHLWDKLVEAYGNDYELSTAPFAITTDGVNDSYALPTDFFKLLGVDLQVSGTSNYLTLPRFNFGERNQYSLPGIQTFAGRTNMKYRLRGNFIWFIPLPTSGMVLRMWYVPRFTPLVNPTDSFDGINGWEEFVVNDAAMKALAKEESDISSIMAMQQVQERRLDNIMENRDAGSPSTVVDIYAATNRGGPGDGGPDGFGW